VILGKICKLCNKKVNTGVFILQEMSKTVKVYLLLTVYYGLIYPHFSYCIHAKDRCALHRYYENITQTPIHWIPGTLSLGVKWPGHEADHFI